MQSEHKKRRERRKKKKEKIKERSERKQEEEERSVVENTEENHLCTRAEREKRWPHGTTVREDSAPRSVIIASGRGN